MGGWGSLLEAGIVINGLVCDFDYEDFTLQGEEEAEKRDEVNQRRQ